MDFSHAVMQVLYSAGVTPLFATAFSGCGSILTFHRICPAGSLSAFAPNSRLGVTPAFFESVIGYLRSHDYKIVTLDEALERLEVPDTSSRFACLTFDDGYRDNFELALPICRSAQAPFTVYVTTGFHDGRYSAWWLGLEVLLASRSALRFEWKGAEYAFDLSTPARKQLAFVSLALLFSPLTGDEGNILANAMCADTQVDFRAHTTQLVLTPEMIAELDQSGVGHIGSHTVSHPRLACMEAEEARQEIRLGSDELEPILGRKIRHMAYPFGRYCDVGPREFEMCREFGLSTAVTTRNANVMREHRGHPTALPRLNIDGDRQTLVAVEVQLSGTPSALLHKFRRIVTA